MPYIGVAHANRIFNGVVLERLVTDGDERMSKGMAGKLIGFVTTRNWNTVHIGSEEYWLTAFIWMEEKSEI
jgi:hypothetical protein